MPKKKPEVLDANTGKKISSNPASLIRLIISIPFTIVGLGALCLSPIMIFGLEDEMPVGIFFFFIGIFILWIAHKIRPFGTARRIFIALICILFVLISIFDDEKPNKKDTLYSDLGSQEKVVIPENNSLYQANESTAPLQKTASPTNGYFGSEESTPTDNKDSGSIYDF